MTETAAPARLTPSLADALAAANDRHHDVPTLYRGGRALAHHYVTRATIFALVARGLAEPVYVRAEIRSRAGLYYKGTREVLDAATLTPAGIAARDRIIAARAAEQEK